MCEQTVAMCCLPDDLLRFTRPAGTLPPASGPRLGDAQVLTTALVAKHYMEQHWEQSRLDKRGLLRRLHALADTLHALFALVGNWLAQATTHRSALRARFLSRSGVSRNAS